MAIHDAADPMQVIQYILPDEDTNKINLNNYLNMINFNPHNHSRANKKVNFGSKQKNIELISTNPMKGIYYSSNFLSSVITQLDQNGK
jgi:hypothetical protein